MKTRVITSAVGLVVLFAVMALFDTFVFNVVIAAICLLAIMRCSRRSGLKRLRIFIGALCRIRCW